LTLQTLALHLLLAITSYVVNPFELEKRHQQVVSAMPVQLSLDADWNSSPTLSALNFEELASVFSATTTPQTLEELISEGYARVRCGSTAAASDAAYERTRVWLFHLCLYNVRQMKRRQKTCDSGTNHM